MKFFSNWRCWFGHSYCRALLCTGDTRLMCWRCFYARKQ